MAVYINTVMIAGNLTRDPQTRFLANDRTVADFSIAMNRRYRAGDGEQKEEVTFVDIEAWGRTAELVGQYLHKGSACYVDGRLRQDSWDDRNGQKRTKLVVVAGNVQFLDPKTGKPDPKTDKPDPDPRTYRDDPEPEF